jgi:predicted Zn finger-like uncharacterized protein
MGEAVVAVEGAHMMMQCPRCSTRWRVATASPMENPLFKCGRCHHLFRQFPGAPAPSEPTTTASRRAAPEPDTLEFIFPDRQPAAIAAREPVLDDVTQLVDATEGVALAAPAPPPAALPSAAMIALDVPDAEPVPRSDTNGVELHVSDHLADDLLAEPNSSDAPFESDDDAPMLDADDPPILGDADDEDDEPFAEPAIASGRRVRVEEIMKTGSGFGTIMRGIAAAVGGFAVLALVLRTSPERTAAWLSRLPAVGTRFATDRNLTTKIELRNVQGKFQRLRNARRVFVISGDARNNSPVTVERIEVAGALYGLGGGELDQKIVTTGNRTALTDLSEAEIVLLQRLDPAIALAPGATTPFLIVFLEPPRELREFSSRVLSVRPTRRASTPSADSRPGSVG